MEQFNYKHYCFVQAPAKAILCGEHAVVYGEDAIAIGISLYCRGTLQRKKKVSLDALFTIKLDIEPQPIQISTQAIKLFELLFADKSYAGSFEYFNQSFRTRIKDSKKWSENYVSLHFKIGIFLSKYNIKWQSWIKLCDYDHYLEVQSTIPLGKCLGSSAAFNTVLATVLELTIHKGSSKLSLPLSYEAKAIINELSVAFESVEHGNPSGIDNFVSVHGGMILFNRNKQPMFKQLKTLAHKFKSTFAVAIADSRIAKNTKVAVEMVQKLCLKSKQHRDNIKAIGEITSEMLSLLQQEEILTKRIFELIRKNHQLLRAFDLSHPELERLRQEGEKLGWAGKITGSGMGGCLLLLAQSQKAMVNEQIRLAQLDEAGLTLTFSEIE